MRLIVQSVRAKQESNDHREFDEFCRSVLNSFEESDFFGIEEGPRKAKTTPGNALLELMTALCVT